MDQLLITLGNKICFSCEWIKNTSDKLWGYYVDAYEWYYDEIWKPIYNIYYAVKRLVINYKYWCKVIAKDEPFDSWNTFTILRHKLINDEKFYRSDRAWGLYSYKIADKIKICILLLDRIIADEYHENVFRYHDKKWGELDMWTTPYSDDLVQLNITRLKICNTDSYEQEKKEHRKLMKKPDEMKKQDVEYLFKIMAKHIHTWWD